MHTTGPIATPASKSSSRMLLVSILLLLGLFGVIVFFVFHVSSDTQDIQELLNTRARALEQKDLALYLTCFSLNYRSDTQTYDELKADASRWFSQFATIQFSFRTVDLQLQDNKAIVENDYKFLVTNTDGNSVHIAKRERLEMQREHKEWKIIRSLSIE